MSLFPKVRTMSNIDKRAWSDYHGLACDDPSLAVQSQKEEADINYIVKQFGITGQLPVGVKVPSFGDFDGVDDYRTAIEVVRAAEDSFLKMPSELRVRLDHDPQKFLEYCADPANLEEMRKLGLALPAVAAEPPKTE